MNLKMFIIKTVFHYWFLLNLFLSILRESQNPYLGFYIIRFVFYLLVCLVEPFPNFLQIFRILMLDARSYLVPVFYVGNSALSVLYIIGKFMKRPTVWHKHLQNKQISTFRVKYCFTEVKLYSKSIE